MDYNWPDMSVWYDTPPEEVEAPDAILPQKIESDKRETRIGLVKEEIDQAKYKEFMRGL